MNPIFPTRCIKIISKEGSLISSPYKSFSQWEKGHSKSFIIVEEILRGLRQIIY